MWMQELQMQKRRIIEADKQILPSKEGHQRYSLYYETSGSYVKANTDTSISLPDEQIITKRINFWDIVLSKDVEAIDKSFRADR